MAIDWRFFLPVAFGSRFPAAAVLVAERDEPEACALRLALDPPPPLVALRILDLAVVALEVLLAVWVFLRVEEEAAVLLPFVPALVFRDAELRVEEFFVVRVFSTI